MFFFSSFATEHGSPINVAAQRRNTIYQNTAPHTSALSQTMASEVFAGSSYASNIATQVMLVNYPCAASEGEVAVTRVRSRSSDRVR